MTSNYVFSDAEIPLAFTNTNLTVSLRQDSGGHPGALIENLTNPTFTSGGTPELYTFTAASEIDLQQGSTYWLVVINPSPLSVQWDSDSGNSLNGITPTGAGATFVGTEFANPFSNGFSPFVVDSTIRPQLSFAIDGAGGASSTPEPQSFVLAVAGLAGLVARKRWRVNTKVSV